MRFEGENPRCEGYECKNEVGVLAESSRTMYCWDPASGEPDPNADVALCRQCAEDHHAHWDDMWSNVYPEGYYYLRATPVDKVGEP